MDRNEVLATLSAPGQPLEIVETEVYGANCRTYKNAPASLCELYQQNLSDESFVVFEDERYSFNDIWGDSEMSNSSAMMTGNSISASAVGNRAVSTISRSGNMTSFDPI